MLNVSNIIKWLTFSIHWKGCSFVEIKSWLVKWWFRRLLYPCLCLSLCLFYTSLSILTFEVKVKLVVFGVKLKSFSCQGSYRLGGGNTSFIYFLLQTTNQRNIQEWYGLKELITKISHIDFRFFMIRPPWVCRVTHCLVDLRLSIPILRIGLSNLYMKVCWNVFFLRDMNW